MICVLFGGFLGRVPYCAARISTSVTFRVSRGSPIKELQRCKQKQPHAIAYLALHDGACAHSEVSTAFRSVRKGLRWTEANGRQPGRRRLESVRGLLQPHVFSVTYDAHCQDSLAPEMHPSLCSAIRERNLWSFQSLETHSQRQQFWR
jgi:hypothetical protein